MSKRGRPSYMNWNNRPFKKPRLVGGYTLLANAPRVTASNYIKGGGFRPRMGYGSVARTRGAAVQGEMKYFDTQLTGTAITAVTTTWPAGTIIDADATINLGDASVPTPLCLFVPKVSAALNGRIGRQVKMIKLKIRGQIRIPPQSVQAGADASDKVRLLVVLDMQTNASQMTGAQLLNDAGTTDATINSYQNPNNFGRFRVLKDKMIDFSNVNMTGAAAAIEQAGMTRSFKFSIKLKGLPVHFNATNGGTVADIVDNSLHIICGTNSTAYAPTLSYYTRVAYKE